MKRSEHTKWFAVGVMVLSASLLSTAHAEEAPGEGFGALEVMPTESLEQTRGRDGVNIHLERVNVQSVQDMDAITAGSSFQVLNGDMATGNITFESGSMGHYSGTGIFNSVTGNANAINNAIGISVYISNP
ncbi:hypothetical protein ACGTN6_03655 [Halomonas sp. THAF12]|uniref:hypothetical protein n=1 Tax=Halomonas sp. B23F22_10 TaxID=3459515 RepID=UPI00373E5706